MTEKRDDKSERLRDLVGLIGCALRCVPHGFGARQEVCESRLRDDLLAALSEAELFVELRRQMP